MKPFWDERYSDEFVSYGTTANDFLRAVAARIPKGPVLEIGAGEGRNAVFLAELGYEVTACDLSEVGLANANKLAAERGVKLTTVVADLADFDFGQARWAGIVSVWAHMPPELRQRVHASCVAGLRPGGAFILEAYAPAHLEAPGVGGPPDRAMLIDPAMIRAELSGLEFELCQEVHRDVNEGQYHTGQSMTTQVVARRRAG